MSTMKFVIHFSFLCVSYTSATLICFGAFFGRGEFSLQNGWNIWTDVKLANTAQYNELYTADTLVRKF